MLSQIRFFRKAGLLLGTLLLCVVPVAFAQDTFIIDDDEIYWDASLGLSGGSIISAEDLQLFRLYQGGLGREPDEGGFRWWAEQIQTGAHEFRSMAAGFIWSTEFLSYFPGALTPNDVSSSAFVTYMYTNVFERQPDAEGLAWWINQLDTGSRDKTQVLIDMTQSNEYFEKTRTAATTFLVDLGLDLGGAVELSSVAALPGQIVLVRHESLRAGDTPEVTFTLSSGEMAGSVFAPVTVDGEIAFATPALFDEDGNAIPGTVSVRIGPLTVAQSFAIQAPLELSVDTRGLIWRANAQESLERFNQSYADLFTIGGDLSVDVQSHAAEIQATIVDLNLAIDIYDATGIASITLDSGEIAQISGDELRMLDRLLLHRTLGVSSFLAARREDGPDAFFPVAEIIDPSVLQARSENVALIDRIYDNWDKIEQALANSEAFNDPDNPVADNLAVVRDVIESIPDVLDDGAEAARTYGVALVAGIATLGNVLALAGDSAIAGVATASNLALAELKAVAVGLHASINQVNTSSLINRAGAEFDAGLEILTQLGSVVVEMGKTQLPSPWDTIAGLDDLRSSTDDMLRGLGTSLCEQLPANPFCAEPLTTVAGTYSTTYGTMVLTQSGQTVEGDYSEDSGRIFGTLSNNNTLTGIWTELSAAVRCDTLRDGREYWGNFTFIFGRTDLAGFSATLFTGTWDYCGGTSGGLWNGSLQ